MVQQFKIKNFKDYETEFGNDGNLVNKVINKALWDKLLMSLTTASSMTNPQN